MCIPFIKDVESMLHYVMYMCFIFNTDVLHTNCLVSHIKSFPSHTAPAGYVCPACSTSVRVVSRTRLYICMQNNWPVRLFYFSPNFLFCDYTHTHTHTPNGWRKKLKHHLKFEFPACFLILQCKNSWWKSVVAFVELSPIFTKQSCTSQGTFLNNYFVTFFIKIYRH